MTKEEIKQKINVILDTLTGDQLKDVHSYLKERFVEGLTDIEKLKKEQ